MTLTNHELLITLLSVSTRHKRVLTMYGGTDVSREVL